MYHHQQQQSLLQREEEEGGKWGREGRGGLVLPRQMGGVWGMAQGQKLRIETRT